MEPVVPLIRFTPLRTVTASGQSFSVNLEIFNVPELVETELLIQFDTERLVLDSITKGSGLDESDVLEPVVGSDLPGLQIIIYDPNDPASGIVDETGYSHLANVYFTSNVQLESAVTALEIVGLSYIASGGARFLPGEVFSHAASVEILGFEAGLLRLLPADTIVQPDGAFGLRLEAHNLLTLYQADMQLVYDETVLRFDSVDNGANLIGSDTIIVSEGSNAGVIELRVSDPNGIEGSIVDAVGYSHMATVYFTALRQPLTAVTAVEIIPVELLAANSVGGSIPVSSVTAEGATVTVTAITNLLMSFLPDPPDPMSSEYFTIDVELFNMASLDSVEFGLLYDTDLIRYDSVSKGHTLDASDVCWVGEGPSAGLLFLVKDTMNGLIVNELGYSHLVRLWFRTQVTTVSTVTSIAPDPISFTLITGDSIRVVDVALADAELNIGPFPDEEIFFDDPKLETIVREAINYPSGPIMWSQVFDLTYLSASEATIDSLGGIEKLVSLTYLQLSYCNIADLSPLAYLTDISYLNLMNNQIDDISPLVDGTVLGYGDYVDLSYNYLTSEDCPDIATLEARGVTVIYYPTSCGVQ